MQQAGAASERTDFESGEESRDWNLASLSELIDHIKACPGVWWATHADIARYVKSAVLDAV